MLTYHAIRRLTHSIGLLIDAAGSILWRDMSLHLLHLFKSTSSGDQKKAVKGSKQHKQCRSSVLLIRIVNMDIRELVTAARCMPWCLAVPAGCESHAQVPLVFTGTAYLEAC